MTTTLPYRGRIYCSLGEVISGQFADSYLQEAGLVFCRGSVELAGIYRPDVGTLVDFAYARGNTAARIPRRLRVLSSFADPFTRITSVQLGCKLSLLQNKRPAPKVDATVLPGLPNGRGIRPETVDSSYATFLASFPNRVAGSVPAAATVTAILAELGITAAGTIPLTHRYMTDEFSLDEGYVAVLGNLLLSESYVGYLNDQERLVIRSLAADAATAGPVLSSDNIFTLSPIGLGELPAERVYVQYQELSLRPPALDSPDTAAGRAGWARSTTVGSRSFYSIPFDGGIYNGSYTPVTTTLTSFDREGRARESVTTSSKPYAAAAGGYASEVLSAGGTVSLASVINQTVTGNSYDNEGRLSQSVVTESVSFAEFAGSLQLRWAFGPGDFVVISPDGEVVKQSTVTTTQYSSNAERRVVQRYQNWALTQAGQQAIAAGNASFTSSAVVSDFFNDVVNAGLQPTGTEVTVSLSSNGARSERLPSLTDLTIQADSPDRQRTDKVVELGYSFGSVDATTSVTFSPPYSPDSYFTFSGSVATPVSRVAQARASALTYGRVQNKLRLGNRQGLSLQIPCELMPVSPFDCMYLVADGLVAQYRANGMSWTFNNQGIVGQVDALFWLAIGNTGTPGDFWFPGPPGVGSLPAAPTITTNASPAAANAAPLPIGWDFQAPDLTELFTDLPVAIPPVFPSVIDTPVGLEPYAETVEVDAVGRAVFEVESFPYSLAPQTTDVDMVGRAVFDVKEVALTAVPVAAFTLTARAPQIYSPAWVPVPTRALTLTSFAPTITGAAVINMPVVALTLTARRPEVRAATILAVPLTSLTLTSFAPSVSPTSFSPLDLSPVAWWDASDPSTITLSGSAITNWADKSGNGWTLSQATATQRPTIATAAINGLDAALWPSGDNDDFLQTASGTFTTAEFYVVARFANSEFSNYEATLNPNSGAVDGWTTGSNVGGSLFFPAMLVYLNGNNASNRSADMRTEMSSTCLFRFVPNTPPLSTTAGVVLGTDRTNAALGRGWNGHICEVVALPSVLSSGDRTDLETYLMDKWGV